KIPPDTDYVINCIGVIKPFIGSTGIVDTIYINSIFPHVLAEYCKQQGMKLIHITTDCVFSGHQVMGEYIESDEHDVTDIYGRTKSLGEPKNKAMVLRTSIIGREIHKQASLVAWVQLQAGREVNGFTNHTWNGITTKTYAKCCQQIIDFDMYEEGIYHIFSPSSVTKCQLVTMISDALDLGVKVNPTEAPKAIHRTLSTIHQLCGKLLIPELFEQLKEL
ncbi:MAG: sugar nucleotide-binding protein, partial [Candidatus Thorarchaeota archaeon]